MRIFLLIFTLLFAINSCKNFRFTDFNEQELQQYRQKDHQYCVFLGLDFGNDDPLRNEVYWRCRILLANHKLLSDIITPEIIQHNSNIRRYAAEILQNFDDSLEKSNDYRNDFINDIQHKKCEKLGFNIDSLEQDKVEKYMQCRKRFIAEWNLAPPFNKSEYLERPSDTYGVPFVINKREDIEIQKYDEAKEQYPFCAKYNIKTEKFKECRKVFEKQKICYYDAKKLKFAQEMEQRVECQKKLYIRFPDSMMKKDENLQNEKNNEKRRSVLADIYSGNSFYTIGVNRHEEDIFHAKKQEKDTTKISKAEINTKNQLYSKSELMGLRNQYISMCNKNVSIRLDEYFKILNDDCAQMTKIWGENNEQ